MRRQHRADRRTKQTGETRSKHPAQNKSDTCDERTNQNTKRRLMKERRRLWNKAISLSR